MPKRNGYDPNEDGTIDVMLDCGVCIGRIPLEDFRRGTFDSACHKKARGHYLRKKKDK